MRKSGWAAATGLGSLVLLLAACGDRRARLGRGLRVERPWRAAARRVRRPRRRPRHRRRPRPRPARARVDDGEGQAAQVGRPAAERRRPVDPGGRHDRHDRAEVRHRLRPRRGQPPGGLHVLEGQEGRQADLHRDLRRDLAAGHGNAPGRSRRHFPGQFGLVKSAGGIEQITYDGLPALPLKGAKPLATTGNGQGGVWHVVKLSASDIAADPPHPAPTWRLPARSGVSRVRDQPGRRPAARAAARAAGHLQRADAGDAAGRAGPDHRRHRAAHHRQRSRRPVPPVLGGHRLHPGQHGDDPGVGQARRPVRPQVPVHRRDRDLPGRLGAVRAVPAAWPS